MFWGRGIPQSYAVKQKKQQRFYDYEERFEQSHEAEAFNLSKSFQVNDCIRL